MPFKAIFYTIYCVLSLGAAFTTPFAVLFVVDELAIAFRKLVSKFKVKVLGYAETFVEFDAFFEKLEKYGISIPYGIRSSWFKNLQTMPSLLMYLTFKDYHKKIWNLGSAFVEKKLLSKEDIEVLEERDLIANDAYKKLFNVCLLYTSPSPRDKRQSRMPSSA